MAHIVEQHYISSYLKSHKSSDQSLYLITNRKSRKFMHGLWAEERLSALASPHLKLNSKVHRSQENLKYKVNPLSKSSENKSNAE